MIWIKIPKVAGTSIKKALIQNGIFVQNAVEKGKVTCLIGSTEIVQEFQIRYPKHWKKEYKFAVVRNPYDRFVSGWKYLDKTRNRSLREVLDNPPGKIMQRNEWFHLVQTQVDMLTDGNGYFIPNQIIHLENLQPALNQALLSHGYPAIEVFQHNKNKRRKPWQNYLKDKGIRKEIYQRYYTDFKVFGYPE